MSMNSIEFTNEELNMLSCGLLNLLDSMNTARTSLPYLPLALEADEKLEILVHNIQDLHSRICSYMKDEPSGPCKFYLFVPFTFGICPTVLPTYGMSPYRRDLMQPG